MYESNNTNPQYPPLQTMHINLLEGPWANGTALCIIDEAPVFFLAELTELCCLRAAIWLQTDPTI